MKNREHDYFFFFFLEMSVLLDSQFFGARWDPSGAAVNVHALWSSHISPAQQGDHAGPAWPPVPLCSEPVMSRRVGCSPHQQVPCLCFVRGLQPGEGTCPQTVNLKAHPLPLVQGRTGCVRTGDAEQVPAGQDGSPGAGGPKKGRTAPLGRTRKCESIKAPSPVRRSLGWQHHHLSLLMRLSHCWHQSGFHRVFNHSLWKKTVLMAERAGF